MLVNGLCWSGEVGERFHGPVSSGSDRVGPVNCLPTGGTSPRSGDGCPGAGTGPKSGPVSAVLPLQGTVGQETTPSTSDFTGRLPGPTRSLRLGPTEKPRMRLNST